MESLEGASTKQEMNVVTKKVEILRRLSPIDDFLGDKKIENAFNYWNS